MRRFYTAWFICVLPHVIFWHILVICHVEHLLWESWNISTKNFNSDQENAYHFSYFDTHQRSMACLRVCRKGILEQTILKRVLLSKSSVHIKLLQKLSLSSQYHWLDLFPELILINVVDSKLFCFTIPWLTAVDQDEKG